MSSLCANDIKRLARAQRIKKIWKRIVMSMATIVVFVTTYMLILPAITISQDVYCGIEEHEHTQSCHSNPDADIETAESWEATIPSELIGNSADRLIAVAKSQLGYTESIENYIIEGESQRGYTRYGAWDGDPYSEWKTTFVEFCLHYADIDENTLPWTDEEYIPEPGDLIFFDDTVDGIVAEVSLENNSLKIIEGDSQNQVRYVTYDLNSQFIRGYKNVAEPEVEEVQEELQEELQEEPQEEPQEVPQEIQQEVQQEEPEEAIEEIVEEPQEPPEKTQTILAYEDEEIQIAVALTESTDISETAELQVKKNKETDSGYIENTSLNQLKDEQTILEYGQYSLALVDEGEEIPLDQEVQVTFTYQPDQIVNSASQVRIMEIDEEQTETIYETEIEGDAAIQTSYMTNELATYDIMLLAASPESIPTGKYGSYNLQYNSTTDAFIKDSAFADYYNENSPLGTAGSFHLVGFGTVDLGTHTNGNVLANTLIAQSNFGTNLYEYELTYALNYRTVNAGSASSTSDHILVIGSNNTISIAGNRDQVQVNGTKIDRPYIIIQDTNTAENPFIDLNRVETEINGIASRLSKVPTTGVTLNFKDENNRSIMLNDPKGAGYYTTTAKELLAIPNFSDRKLKLKGFVLDNNGSLVINVDCTGVTEFTMPEATIFVGDVEQNTNETTNFTSGKVIWNFINAEGVTINTKRMTGMVIAPGATINIMQNLNGTVVAENINVKAESHRTDFTGDVEIPTEEEEETTDLYIRVRKVDVDNISIYLDGAVFDLYRWDRTSGQYVLEQPNLSYSAGNALILKPLIYNQAYKLVETKAPMGYRISEDAYEFIVSNSNTSKYPVIQPGDFRGRELTGGQTLYYRNERMQELIVEKKWKNSSGTEYVPTQTEILIDLWRNVYSEAECTTLIRTEMCQSGIAIKAEEDWRIVISDLPKSEANEYYNYFVKEQENADFNVSYEGNSGTLTGLITITNQEKVKYELPATGGFGKDVTIRSGMLLVIMAVIMIFMKIKRKNYI